MVGIVGSVRLSSGEWRLDDGVCVPDVPERRGGTDRRFVQGVVLVLLSEGFGIVYRGAVKIGVMNELGLTTLACFILILICGKMPILSSHTVFLLKIYRVDRDTGESILGDPNGALRGPDAEIRRLRGSPSMGDTMTIKKDPRKT